MKEPKQKLIITKKLKGDDEHKVFSIRLKDETVTREKSLDIIFVSLLKYYCLCSIITVI